jgi:hypothetical protein
MNPFLKPLVRHATIPDKFPLIPEMSKKSRQTQASWTQVVLQVVS